MSIVINLDKAKNIAHDMRRAKRSKEFEPYDEIIMKQIPGNDYVAAESKRQEIRDKYVLMQNAIDSAQNPEELKELLDG